jgi:hypothetical protein
LVATLDLHSLFLNGARDPRRFVDHPRCGPHRSRDSRSAAPERACWPSR